MDPNLKKAVGGIAVLFLIFCVSVAINRFFDRSADDDIIINSQESTEYFFEETQTETETEPETSSFSVNGETDGFNGYLKYQKKSGDVYDGNWKDGKYNGSGVLTRKSGEVYDGNWVSGAFESGKITYKINNFGGTKTVDISYDEKWNGTGICALILENGDIYDGQWYGGKKNGDGTLYSGSRDKIQTGIWDEDVLIDGTETSLYSDGLRTYVVQVKDGFKNGKGILYDQNGNVLQEEQWINDEPVE